MELDRSMPITLTETECQDGAMALRTARVLGVGLAHLYECVRGVELQVARRFETEGGPNLRRMVYGSAEELSGVPVDLVECAFRWYAVSLCDFVRIISFLGRLNDDTRSKYSTDVIGAVQAFRDKVGAHTAGFTQNRRDNDAERGITPCSQVAWNDNRFEVGTFSMYVRRGDKASDSGAIQPWRLTELHEQLCVRYPMLDQLSHKAD